MTRALLVALTACGRIGFDATAPVADAAADAAADAHVGFCASQSGLVFCDDFDEGNGTAQWDFPQQSMGTIAVDNADSVSAPSSFVAQTISLANMQQASASIQKTNFPSYQHVVAKFSLHIVNAGTSDAVLCGLIFDDGAELHEIELVARAGPGTAYVEDANTPSGMNPTFQSYDTTRVLPADGWHDITIDYTSGASANLVVMVDSTAFLDQAPIYTTGGQFKLVVGMVFINGPATPWTVRFDNVTVSAQ